jgi:preprotein translocase subunit SecD
VFFFFTKPMVSLLARRTFFNSGNRMSGLSRETLGVDVQRGGTKRLVGGQV